MPVDAGNWGAVTALRARAADLQDTFSRGMLCVLQGDVGRGKSAIAWLFARAVVNAPDVDAGPNPAETWYDTVGYRHSPINSVLFVKWPELVEAKFDAGRPPYKPDPLKAARRADLLVIDDVGRRGTFGDREDSWLWQLVEDRYATRRPLVLTTELFVGPGSRCLLSAAIVSRLTQSDRSLSLGLEGPDRRQRR